MNQALLNQFLLGAVVMACGVAGLFFIRFWRKTRERLFAIFAVAFWTLGLNWLALAFINKDEVRTLLYVVRLAAFLLILYGILDKNRKARPRAAARLDAAPPEPQSTGRT
jgi:xanthine/uracil permease